MKIPLRKHRAKESFLFFGLPKQGKTWATMSLIDACLTANKKVFILNTDDGVLRTMKMYFGDRFNEIADKVEYYLVQDINETEEAIDEVTKVAQAGDLVVLDLISDVWWFAQEKMVNQYKPNDDSDYIAKSSADKSKFGLFSGNLWSYVKKLESVASYNLVIKNKANVVCVSAGKSIEHDKLHDNRKILDWYEKVGYKPDGNPDLRFRFNTIIFIGMDISSNKIQPFFIVLGDRGSQKVFDRVEYQTNFWSAFKEWRKK